MQIGAVVALLGFRQDVAFHNTLAVRMHQVIALLINQEGVNVIV